ncbi:glycine cleavage system protein R [Psychrosphaera algicola]|uniref:Glycine cleavage system transcriptional repressor n=1 Tax=Psychrosphaera algicola TaxID=3023714 RepID=A0ABT5FH81_9GAMM|nr:ACT domain-containing protein [Psychrosphaera sp. G1-22]MDC2890561.1 glycine cleavage system protein R [Psychrosphaera sp. G1-22]
MKKLVLTVIGKDKVGLVQNLSNVLVENHGNWLASNLSHLSGYFAGVVEVEVAEEFISDLTSALSQLDDLKIDVHDGTGSESDQNQQIEFVITGNDRKGIVRELSEIIQHKGASIVNFTSSRQSAPNWGGGLFHAVAKVELPVGLDADVIAEALEELATDIVVDLELAS